MGSARRRRGPVRAPGGSSAAFCVTDAPAAAAGAEVAPAAPGVWRPRGRRLCPPGAPHLRTPGGRLTMGPHAPPRAGGAGTAAAPSPSAGSQPAAAAAAASGSQRAWRAAGRPDAARARCGRTPAPLRFVPPLACTPRRRRPAPERPHGAPHLRARRLPLLHLFNYKGSAGSPCPPGGSPLAGPAAPPAAAAPAATAWLRAGDRVPPPLPRLSELLGSF